jgi:hypothetical protein
MTAETGLLDDCKNAILYLITIAGLQPKGWLIPINLP